MSGQEYRFVEHEKPYRYTEGDLTVTRGSAWSGPGCHLGCGVLLYTDKDGKLVKVEGDPENPYNEGRLCVRCLALPEVTNHPDRLMYPMKRARSDRGKDKFERISWDEAFDTIEQRFGEIKEKYGAESVVFSQGTGRDIAAYITRLAWSFGSPNYLSFLSGIACFAPRVAGSVATSGAMWIADCSQQFPDRYDDPEYQLPETMFIWGNYPLTANSDGLYGHWIIDLMRRGTKIVMVDPRVTWLSARAAIHLPVRPGCDAALALGMLNVIVNEGLYDEEFVEEWTYGFGELVQRVAEYTPARVAEICWVPEEKIVEAANLLAASKPAALQWGVAVDMTKEALPAGQAIMALFQVTGNIDIPGGMVIPPNILNYAGGWGQELISEEQAEKRIGLDRYSLLRFGFQLAHPDVVVNETMQTDKPYPLRAAWIQTTNPIACMGAQPSKLYSGFEKFEFIVVVDIFKTPTVMAFADIVLPAATYPERDGLRLGDGAQRGETINKVCQIGECKSDMEINLEMGRRFNPAAWPWKDVKEMYDYLLEDTGMKFDELREVAPAFLPYQYGLHEKGLLRADGRPGFNTSTGRIELWSSFYSMAGLDPLPYFEEPAPGPGATPELMEEYPLVLTTGKRVWSMFHSEHRNIPRLRAMRPDPLVEMHPDTAEKYGLSQGDWVWVENQLGRAKRRVAVTPVLDPRIVSTDHGWWLPEADPENLYDVKDYAINNLVPWVPGKSGFGSNYKTTLVKIYKVEGE